MKNYTVPKRDFQKREYFMVEADSSIEEVRKQHPSWRYEYLDRALGKYHVFSLPKKHRDVFLLKRMSGKGLLEKRDGESTLKSVYMLPEKKLERRAPVPEEYWGERDSEMRGEVNESEDGGRGISGMKRENSEMKGEDNESEDNERENSESENSERENSESENSMNEEGENEEGNNEGEEYQEYEDRNKNKNKDIQDIQDLSSRWAKKESKKVTDSSQLVVEKAREEFGIDDPQFSQQWHIVNAEFPGEDVDVVPVWRQNITGKGVVTAIIDDGLDFENPDLAGAFCAEGSWDYNDNTALPRPRLQDDYHGTRCAGEIAAALGNGFCGVGVAHGSRVSGVRILSGSLTAEDEAAAMVHALGVNDIYSCSWGPPDNGRAMDVPDKIVREAILKGVQEGRSGKGALYVFASGNGALHQDSCNFDGYTNSIYSITVTALDHRGLHPQYAESCAAVMVAAYSSGSGAHISTTDFKEGCSARHGGTSAAAPLAAGLYALVLEANPALTWRDVQQLTVMAAVQVHPEDPGWQDSAIPGRRYSYKFGWGKLDAAKIVAAARDNYRLLRPQAWYYTPYLHLGEGQKNDDKNNISSHVQPEGSNLPWPDHSVIFSSSFDVSQKGIANANLHHIEQITVTVNVSTSKRGAVYIRLVSPHGIVSRLAQQRPHDTDSSGFNNWTFSSVAHWGEDPVGKWEIQVINTEPDSQRVEFHGWQLRFFGECVDPKRARRFDMDKDYSEEGEKELTSILSVSSLSTSTSALPLSSSSSSSTLPLSSSSSSSTLPLSSSPSSSSSSSSSPPSSHTLPSDHADWYFLALLLLGFGICMWMLKCRKKPGRARQRDEYEFEIINPDEEDSDFDHNSHFQPSIDSSEDVSGSPAAKNADADDENAETAHDELFNNSYAQDDQSAFNTEEEERERLFNTSNADDPFRVSDDDST
ncbi:hypothetical protein HII12_003724 [Brettanomyces bruxellensis]|uniref:P/Homo B domain-containing protein n=1 Tax=Dekkera bruxellensis TaxID=5007 RepID=A0A8H6BD67_DEKBR|nr:hypothetical protein HII12_003724 [Brettanomyces bruxellensis]